MFRELRKTVFCDIDGTIFLHKESLHDMVAYTATLLPGVIAKFTEWREKDYYIVLTTARPEGTRSATMKQLNDWGIFFDQLVMGLPVGPRVVINDRKPDGTNTALSICIPRNEGLKNVEI